MTKGAGLFFKKDWKSPLEMIHSIMEADTINF